MSGGVPAKILGLKAMRKIELPPSPSSLWGGRRDEVWLHRNYVRFCLELLALFQRLEGLESIPGILTWRWGGMSVENEIYFCVRSDG